MAEWFEDEATWRETARISFSPAKIAAGRDEAERLIALADFRGGAVLDLCCGPGRHAIPLAAKGYEVTGVDLTRCLLEQAEARAQAAGVAVTFVQEDMRRFVDPERFSLAICLYVSFGYFEDRADDRLVLSNVFRSLEPGGTFILECAGKESLALRFQAFSGFEVDGRSVFMRRRLADDFCRTHNETILIDGEAVHTYAYSLNLYSGQEIRQLLSAAGFSAVSLHGNLAGDPYDDRATTLIAVARKA